MKHYILSFFALSGLVFAFSTNVAARESKEKIPLSAESSNSLYFSKSDPVVALYHLHSGEPLPDGSELAQEFNTIYGYSDYKRFAQKMSRTSDAFAIREMGEELKKRVQTEMDELGDLNTFALSSFQIQIEPYDFENGGYVICCFRSKDKERDGYMTGMGVGGYLMQYRLPVEKFGYRIDENTARKVESIFSQRTSRTLFTNSNAVMHFEVDGVEKQTIRRRDYNVVVAKPVRLEIVDYLQEFLSGSQSNYETLMSIDLTELN